MRRYAQLVKLSPDEIAASFDQYYSADTETPDLHERAQNPIQLLGSLVSPRLRLRKVLSMASIGLVLALLVGFLWHGFSTRETSTIVEPAVKAAVVKEKASTVVSVPVSTGNTVTVPVASTPSVPVEAATSVSTPAAASAPSVVNVVSPPAVMVPAATVPAIPTRSAQPNSAVSVGVGSDTLVIHLSAESWVSVQDSLQSLVSELKPAGQTLTLKGQAPFRINLGNAPAVSVTLNGKAIDLRPYTKGAVATLTARP
jgi:cytoskeleton protein RodZ